MAAIDYLHTHGLQAEPLPGDQLSVWPAANITPQVRNWIRQHKDELLHELAAANDSELPGLEGDIELLLTALTDAGRALSPELEYQLRKRLRPLSREVRAELVAAVDDAFEVAPDTATARQQACRLLTSEKALQAAKAVWPAYPDSPEPESDTEPLTPWPSS